MNETQFFKELFPQKYKLIKKSDLLDFEEQPFYFVKDLEELDTPRTEEEGPVCECVGENTNKALVLYFQSIINQGIELPIFINNKNQIMDGHHRVQAYHLLGRTKIPIYRNRLTRIHGFCWKKGIEGKRRLRLKTW
jgi:hypothetical protein